jgi:hypothetical protein
MLLLMNYQIKQQFTLVQQLIFGLNGVDAHQRGFMRFSAIHPKWWRASSEIGAKSFQLYYGYP